MTMRTTRSSHEAGEGTERRNEADDETAKTGSIVDGGPRAPTRAMWTQPYVHVDPDPHVYEF